MEDPPNNSPPADALDQELSALFDRIAAEPVSPALRTCALELFRALEATGKLRPGKPDRG